MAESRRNLLVGIFVLVGLGALGTLIVLFGRGPTWLVRGQTYPLHIRFEHIAGIRVGNLVTLRGIEIGRVQGVSLFDPQNLEAGVDVLVSIDQRYRLPLGSEAQTTAPVLGQGRPPIELVAGPSGAEWLPPGATINGTVRGAFETVFPSGVVSTFQTAARQIGDAAEALAPVLDELQELLAARPPAEVDRPGGPPGNLSSAVARLDSALRHFNEVLGDAQVKSDLRQAVANFHSMSEKGARVMGDLESAAKDSRELMADGRKLVARADQSLANLDSRVQELSRAALGSLDKADVLLDHLNAVGQQITSGQGTIGGLVMDSKLHEALVISAERLALLVQEFRALVEEWRKGRIRVAL